MTHLQKLGGIAAFINVIVVMATLATVIFLIGFSAIADPSKLIDLAIHNPTPLLIQDGLKLVSAGISTVLILALGNYLQCDTPGLLSVATKFGFLSVLCLVGNAILSLYAIFQASTYDRAASSSNHLHNMIGILAVAAISLDGLWFLLMSWTALKSQKLPNFLCYLGLGMGILSLVPPLGIIVLMLSMVWSVWMGQVLLKEESTG
ncbi:MAG: hypothetical protein JGK17_25740 [Microcoleus sp. PH2017_10_PVI_O_A]|uniref:hypothetical protein n=1 Tax=unclassified Microcoleus TaxID=2642155 RepID=UPI001DC86226|nr:MULTISPECIES: hypothetical protein [unclassified Microcoleus]TAE78059.1 MAG: hypothetical protein EAZ83_25480 [Oscillatoriales cyanobacterium]MCC3408914.1 hypothetical protein [Microcoleus sp. PH2017_10_PVI_O_A]MCC3463050.1 hypothetical protein [Microcoleus sp. PH2017_11_PCY_U_A]MCC3481436.1 hypothetical protein [Microcoleus sp. PH2017_12_PCY_D_A]MCC3531436.1 hypothetical protein [Microcoleus sp. PH2017_21_RUC_O_A]